MNLKFAPEPMPGRRLTSQLDVPAGFGIAEVQGGEYRRQTFFPPPEEERRMYREKLLVVANQTVDSDELYDTLHARAEHGPLAVTLLVPQDQQAGLGQRVNAALDRLHAGGVEAEAMLGDVDPACAVIEVWDPRRWDEILVSTLPNSTSRWLQIDLPHRIQRAIDAPVSHIEAHPAAAAASRN